MSFKAFFESFNPNEYNKFGSPDSNFRVFVGKDTIITPEIKKLMLALKPIFTANAPSIKGVVIMHHFAQRVIDRSIDIDKVISMVTSFYSSSAKSMVDNPKREEGGVIKKNPTNVVFAYNTNGTQGVIEDDLFKLITVMDKPNFVPSNKDDVVHHIEPDEFKPKDKDKDKKPMGSRFKRAL